MRKWNLTSILTPLNYPKLMAEKLTLYCSGLSLVDGCLRSIHASLEWTSIRKQNKYSGNLTSPTTFIFFFLLFIFTFIVFFIFIVFFFIFFIFSSSKQQLQPRRRRRQRSQPEPTQQQQQQHIVYEHKRLGW